MSRLTLITGPVASGKSRYACLRAAALGTRVLFVATCDVRDDAMREKVERHRDERPPSWDTVETPRDLARAVRPGYDAAVIDCLTLFASQMLVDGRSEAEIHSEIDALAESETCPLFVVTNEVGWGVVPVSPLGRAFRDLLGRVNQRAARSAREVVLLIAGIPLFLKEPR